jgi:hypothetical protein
LEYQPTKEKQMLKFTKIDSKDLFKNSEYRAHGNVETVFEIHKDSGINGWYCVVWQYGYQMRGIGPVKTMRECRAYANLQNSYLDGIE